MAQPVSERLGLWGACRGVVIVHAMTMVATRMRPFGEQTTANHPVPKPPASHDTNSPVAPVAAPPRAGHTRQDKRVCALPGVGSAGCARSSAEL